MGLPRQRRAELPRSVPAASSRVTGQAAGDRGPRHPPPRRAIESPASRGALPHGSVGSEFGDVISSPHLGKPHHHPDHQEPALLLWPLMTPRLGNCQGHGPFTAERPRLRQVAWPCLQHLGPGSPRADCCSGRTPALLPPGRPAGRPTGRGDPQDAWRLQGWAPGALSQLSSPEAGVSRNSSPLQGF